MPGHVCTDMYDDTRIQTCHVGQSKILANKILLLGGFSSPWMVRMDQLFLVDFGRGLSSPFR